MKRFVSKLCLAAVLAVLTCGTAFAASAKVTYVKGKVEVSRGNAWVAVKVGDEIKELMALSRISSKSTVNLLPTPHSQQCSNSLLDYIQIKI